MRALVVTALAALACGGALLGGSAARADADVAPVLDRSYVCAVALRGGAFIIEAHAHAGTRLDGKWTKLPYAGLHTGGATLATGNLLAWVTAGKPMRATTVDQDYNIFDVDSAGTAGVRREPCRHTSTRVPFTAAGLRGGSAPPLGSELECFVLKQVVVRVRATLVAPGRLRPGDDFHATHVPVREAKLAVRTLAGKPLVYADVRESGRARLFAAQGCISR